MDAVHVITAELMPTRVRADIAPHRPHRRGETEERDQDVKAADPTAVAARHRGRSSSECGTERFSRFAVFVRAWRDVAAAWLVAALVVAVATWASLRAEDHRLRIAPPTSISTPASVGTCPERDYANERR